MKAGDDAGPIAGAILYILAGPIIWSAHLFLTYGPQSGLCAFRITGVAAVDPMLVAGLVGIVTLLSVAALVFILLRPKWTARLFRMSAHLDDDASFIPTVMRLLAALSLAGVLWAGATALLLSPCAQLR